jgi:hypothetical protein
VPVSGYDSKREVMRDELSPKRQDIPQDIGVKIGITNMDSPEKQGEESKDLVEPL